MKIENIIKEFSKTNKSTFLSIKGYTTAKGETKDYLINFKSEYKNAVEKSLIKLFKFMPSTEEEKLAKEEIVASLTQSLNNEVTESVTVGGKVVRGLKRNESGKLYITGLVVQAKSNEKSVKQKIYSTLPVSRFRQFEVSPSKMKSIVINGKKIRVS